MAHGCIRKRLVTPLPHDDILLAARCITAKAVSKEHGFLLWAQHGELAELGLGHIQEAIAASSTFMEFIRALPQNGVEVFSGNDTDAFQAIQVQTSLLMTGPATPE